MMTDTRPILCHEMSMERLSGLDASFLYMETPQVHMHVGLAAIFDPKDMPGGYSSQKITRHIAARVRQHAAFRRRLARVPFDLHHPVWVDDPDFDVIHHIRQVALPRPGGPEEFGSMVGRIISTPLDRSRPLWEAWIIEGLQGGRFGVMLKLHHSAVDGVSGAGLFMLLMNDTPDPEPEPVAPLIQPERVPTELELVGSALKSRLKQPLEFGGMAFKTIKRYAGLVQQQRDPEISVGGRPLDAPRTPFNASVSARRNLATTRLSLMEIKEVKKALGITVNDVVLATIGGALRRYLQGHGALPETSLTAVCPISVRTKEQMGQANNRVSALWTQLHTELGDPVARAHAINEVTARAKDEHHAMGAQMLQDWAQLTPPRIFNMAIRFYSWLSLADKHRPIHNLVVSNVPGPRFPLYLAGGRLEAVYPMGPVMEGAGLNVTVFSYGDAVDFGFLVDSNLVPDVWELAKFTDEAFAELRGAVCAAKQLA